MPPVKCPSCGHEFAIALNCLRCKHEWNPRNLEEQPRVCPSCKSPYWNKPRKKTKRKTTPGGGT